MNIIYRIATVRDIPKLLKLRIAFLYEISKKANISKQSCVSKNQEQYLLNHIGTNNFICWHAVEKGKVIAIGDVRFHHDPAVYDVSNNLRAYISSIYVLPEHRLCGLGSGIMKKLMKEATERNVKYVTLVTTRMNNGNYEEFTF